MNMEQMVNASKEQKLSEFLNSMTGEIVKRLKDIAIRLSGSGQSFEEVCASLRTTTAEIIHAVDVKTSPIKKAVIKKPQFYAVAVGHIPGIYSTWDEANVQIVGKHGAKHKKFKTHEEADAYLKFNDSLVI